MDILQQKLIGYPSRVNYTKIIENCKTRQRDYFKTRTFYTYTYIYFLFWQIFTRKAEERNNFSRPIHDSMCSSLFPNAYPVHMCATLLAPKFIANPSPPSHSPLPGSRHILSITITDASTSTTARPTPRVPSAFHTIRRTPPSLQHFVPVFLSLLLTTPLLLPLLPRLCLPRSLVGIILALGNYR